MLVVPCGLVAGFSTKFYKSRIAEVVGGGNMVGRSLDVYFLDYACRSCSSKLAILAILFLMCSSSFW
jgi:hypothetical protein